MNSCKNRLFKFIDNFLNFRPVERVRERIISLFRKQFGV